MKIMFGFINTKVIQDCRIITYLILKQKNVFVTEHHYIFIGMDDCLYMVDINKINKPIKIGKSCNTQEIPQLSVSRNTMIYISNKI